MGLHSASPGEHAPLPVAQELALLRRRVPSRHSAFAHLRDRSRCAERPTVPMTLLAGNSRSSRSAATVPLTAGREDAANSEIGFAPVAAPAPPDCAAQVRSSRCFAPFGISGEGCGRVKLGRRGCPAECALSLGARHDRDESDALGPWPEQGDQRHEWERARNEIERTGRQPRA